jgi:AAA domain
MANLNFPDTSWLQVGAASGDPPTDWVWYGFVARARITLLTSLWKAGKTTLLSLLLSRRKQGGELAGLAVQPGKSVVISEEPLSLWTERGRRYEFGDHVGILSRPFGHIPTAEEWQALVDHILALRAEHGLDLAVIDPLAPYLRNENHPSAIFATLFPLRALTQAGMAVMLLHHPGKGARPIGQAARGSGALLGHVDISMEMRHPGGDPFTRRRRFLTLSRHAETPRQLLLELNATATDYVPVAETDTDASSATWQALRMILLDAGRKLTRQEVLAAWPEDLPRPAAATLWKWLDRAVRNEMIACAGTGRKNDPFRYWLPGEEAG